MKEIIIGGIYITDWISAASKLIMPDLGEKYVRVIAYDNNIVFHEGFDSEGGTMCNNLTKKCFYSRIMTEIFLRTTNYIKVEAFSEYELRILRPDLPIVVKDDQLVWSQQQFPTLEDYNLFTELQGCYFDNSMIVDSNEIFLYPIGKRGGIGKGHRVKSLDGQGFSKLELFWRANNLQAEYLAGTTNRGVGVVRAGFEKQIPSYFIDLNEDKD